MALSWSPWIALDPENAGQLGPNAPGLYEVKLEAAVVDYPSGKSAMIYYGTSDDDAPTVREALHRDWFVEDKAEVLQQWTEYGELVWRFALQPDPTPDHQRRVMNFVQRFGRLPWANPAD